jgi:outer membrane protein OmpA-like peptidoglycan-associated protein
MAAATLVVAPYPAQAQRGSGEGEVQRLIDQLQPAGTRGIRVPGEAPPPRPAPAAPSRDQAVAPSARPAPVRPAAPPQATTTARDGLAAVSLTVLFPTGSAELNPTAARQLEALGRALSSTELSPYRFRIEGHTDTVGTRESNQALSERRAAAVRGLLIQRFGIDPARLESIGLGEDQLLVVTPDETGEQRNRRVQIVNLGS